MAATNASPTSRGMSSATFWLDRSPTSLACKAVSPACGFGGQTDRIPFGDLRRPGFVCHEKQVSVLKTERIEAFRPHLPFFLLGRTGRPFVSVHRDGKAAIGYSS